MTASLELKSETCMRGRQTVLDALSLAVMPGSCLVLAGELGSGKMSLLRLLAGLGRRECGQIRIDGTMVDDAARCFIPPEQRTLRIVF